MVVVVSVVVVVVVVVSSTGVEAVAGVTGAFPEDVVLTVSFLTNLQQLVIRYTLGTLAWQREKLTFSL